MILKRMCKSHFCKLYFVKTSYLRVRFAKTLVPSPRTGEFFGFLPNSGQETGDVEPTAGAMLMQRGTVDLNLMSRCDA